MFVRVLVFAVLATVFAEESDVTQVSKSYIVSSDLQNWFQASINCASIGMQLATVLNQTEEDHLEKYLRDNGHTLGYWLYATNLGNGNYYWVSTGKPMIYTNWVPGEPDNATLLENNFQGEHCVQYGVGFGNPTKPGWNDMRCNFKLPYICETVRCP